MKFKQIKPDALKAATIGSLATMTIMLAGCGGSSSGSNEAESLEETNEVVAPVEKIYTDTTWVAGTDGLLGLTYPKGADNGPMILLKRTEDSEGDDVYQLLSADDDTREFGLVRNLDASKYYRDVLAVPLVGTVDGVTIDDTLVITCGSDDAGYLEGEALVGTAQEKIEEVKVSAQSVAVNPANPAQLEMYLVNDSTKTYTVTLETTGGAKIERCASLGGLSVVVNDGVVGISVLATGENDYNSQSSVVLNIAADFELGTMTLPEANIVVDSSYSDRVGFVSAAVLYDNRHVGFLITNSKAGTTADFLDFDDNAFLFSNDQSSNPFNSVGSWTLDTVRDLAVVNSSIYFVSDSSGLGGIDFGGDPKAVAIPAGAETTYGNCVDALAVDGTTLWCHDSTDEGSLIQFTAPTVPASEGSSTFERPVRS